jgi:cytochrome c oxidase cbb3-type subunit 3
MSRILGFSLALLVGSIGLAWTVWTVEAGSADAALLRADPDRIAQDTALSSLATVRAASAYQASCASCHGTQMQGDPRRGIPPLARRDRLYGSGSVAELERVILYGIRSGNPKGWNLAIMPAYASPVPYARDNLTPLTPSEIRDLAAYLTSIEGGTADAGAVQRGIALYHGKGGCYDCHGQDEAGESAIGAPTLKGTVRLYGDGSPDSLMSSIAMGHRGVCPAWIGRLSPVTIRALAAYIYLAGERSAMPQ